MSALIPEEHKLFVNSVEQVLRDVYGPADGGAISKIDRGFNAANWALFAELGWIGAMFSEKAGGYGDGILETMLLFERIGGSLVVEPLLDCALIPGQLLAKLGGDLAHGLLGEIIAGGARLALLDCGPGSAPGFRVEAAEAGYHISGSAAVVRGAAFADAFILHAADADGRSFLLRLGKEQAGRTDFQLVDSSSASELSLDRAFVPADALIADGSIAVDALDWSYDVATLAICAEAVGAIDRCVWITRDYLKTRKQFGQPLASFQALQHRMADMLLELELARALVRRVSLTFLALSADERNRFVPACKVTIGRAGAFVAANAVQLHGGIGVTDEYVIGHYFKRLLAINRQLGDMDFHRGRFAAP